ncbi:MAG: hypothetical protein AAF585_11290 [Verrucomicrobiota bacterium]
MIQLYTAAQLLIISPTVDNTTLNGVDNWLHAVDDGNGGLVLSGENTSGEIKVLRLNHPLDIEMEAIADGGDPDVYETLYSQWTTVIDDAEINAGFGSGPTYHIADHWHLHAHGYHWIVYSVARAFGGGMYRGTQVQLVRLDSSSLARADSTPFTVYQWNASSQYPTNDLFAVPDERNGISIGFSTDMPYYRQVIKRVEQTIPTTSLPPYLGPAPLNVWDTTYVAGGYSAPAGFTERVIWGASARRYPTLSSILGSGSSVTPSFQFSMLAACNQPGEDSIHTGVPATQFGAILRYDTDDSWNQTAKKILIFDSDYVHLFPTEVRYCGFRIVTCRRWPVQDLPVGTEPSGGEIVRYVFDSNDQELWWHRRVLEVADLTSVHLEPERPHTNLYTESGATYLVTCWDSGRARIRIDRLGCLAGPDDGFEFPSENDGDDYSEAPDFPENDEHF